VDGGAPERLEHAQNAWHQSLDKEGSLSMRLFGVCALMAFSLAVSTGMAAAANAADQAPVTPPPVAGNQPTAMNVIFEHKHLSNVDQGVALGYRFNRIVSNPQLLGEPFSDEITMKVVGVRPTGEKDVDLQIYTGERARELQNIPSVTINPMFIVYFDMSVSTLKQLTGAKYGFLKAVFSDGFKDKAKIEPMKLAYKGKTIDAYRITMAPYVGDPHANTMQGYDVSKFTMVVSNDVPGEVVQLSSLYESSEKAAPKLEERITLDGAEVK
jgi:hypothetical protein